MLKQKKNSYKKYKLNQLQKIKQTYKFIYLFRYNDLSINEIISIKKKLKKLNYKSLTLNQKLTTHSFSKLKGEGSILIIYGNDELNLIHNLIKFKKLELIYLSFKNQVYSNLKIKQILFKSHPSLNNLIVQPFLNFIYYLRKI
jgi:hypothetical protein